MILLHASWLYRNGSMTSTDFGVFHGSAEAAVEMPQQLRRGAELAEVWLALVVVIAGITYASAAEIGRI
eukprot:SAG22_NODE_155_length_17123_cov_37.528489_23_plen_69_part_00